MRTVLLGVWVVLTGCLQAVGVPGATDASPGLDANYHNELDASSPYTDASYPSLDGAARGCSSDLECRTGQICQETSCGQPKSCIDGCRDASGCGAGRVCAGIVSPFCGLPYGHCAPSPACTTDKDCPAGSSCDFSGVGGLKACIAGCHTSDQCGAGQECVINSCPKCMNCACVGQCQSKAACTTDKDCTTPGTVCGSDPMTCARRCLAGCHDDTQCRPDEFCPLLACDSCGCDPSHCQPRPVGCSTNADCKSGEICGYDDHFKCGGTKSCQPGCLLNSDCAQDEACAPANCGPCCPGACLHVTPGCTTDQDCKAGMVCEFGAGCAGVKTCVPGCHTSDQCGVNGQCLQPACKTCPCPGTCAAVVCPLYEPSCGQTTDCSWNSSYCQGGCCQPCPVYDAPPCFDPSQCMYGNGVDLQGCAQGPTCGPCCACPALTDPVCGTNYQTYQGSCEATCAGVTVLHPGACLAFEGMGCNFAPSMCASGQYCRDACPMCDVTVMRCTQIGACVYDQDCPAGFFPPTCAGALWKCQGDHTCTFTCPP